MNKEIWKESEPSHQQLHKIKNNIIKYQKKKQILKISFVTLTCLILFITCYQMTLPKESNSYLKKEDIQDHIIDEKQITYYYKKETITISEQTQVDIAAFQQQFLKECCISIKGTVISYNIKDDTQICKVKIEKIFKDKTGSYKINDIITIYNHLYSYTSLADSVEILQKKGTYYLNLLYRYDHNKQRLDSYSLLYPFDKQIEESKNHVIIFSKDWKNLINENTYKINFKGYYNEYYGRIDNEFDKDYQTLINKYIK